MDFCYEPCCDDYEVTPVFAPCPSKSCERPSACYPCLPRCPKSVVYCCEKPHKSVVYRCEKPKKQNPMCCSACDKGEHTKYKESKPHREPDCMDHAESCHSYCMPTCKPVKTKYVIPCYRYEDGRIKNQPTVLTRRACEVAVGVRPKKKPFVRSEYCSEGDEETHRYQSEDEKGNCCFHFEKKNRQNDYAKCINSDGACYADCVHARIASPQPPKYCCYYQ